MKKVVNIIYLEKEERSSDFSTGIKFIFEDGSTLEQMTTDVIADKFTDGAKTISQS